MHVSQIGIREDALVLFDLREEELLSDLHITKQAVLRKRYGNHPEQFLDQYAQQVDRNVPADVLCLAASEAATDSVMKKPALQLLIQRTVALIRTHRWKGPCFPPLLKTDWAASI